MHASLVLNDLSIASAATRSTASDWLTEFFLGVSALVHNGLSKPEIHAEQDLYAIQLVDGYGPAQWVSNQDVDRDLRMFALEVATRTTIITFVEEVEEAADQFLRSEFSVPAFGDQDASSLGAAVLRDGIAVGFASQEIWDNPVIQLRQRLYDQNLENWTDLALEALHVARFEHVDPVSDSWRVALAEGIKTFDDLLECWEQSFPSLDYCVEFEQFRGVLSGDTLASVLKRLHQLNGVSGNWDADTEGNPVYGFQAQPESTSTLNQFGAQREFTCPHSGRQVFSMHCRIQPHGYRLHWYENRDQSRFTIGYVGPHLPTVKFKAQ